MRKTAFLPCIPTRGTKVPAHPDWLHEIKHDGYRLIVQRDGKRVRLWTRNGYDWSGRFPLITEAALRIKVDRFVVDGEAVLLGVDGVSDFEGLHSRKFDHEAQFYAFDMLSQRRGRFAVATALSPQGRPRPTAQATGGRHHPERLRARRDRTRPVQGRLPDGAGGPGFEAPGPALSRRPIATLDQRSKTRARPR